MQKKSHAKAAKAAKARERSAVWKLVIAHRLVNGGIRPTSLRPLRTLGTLREAAPSGLNRYGLGEAPLRFGVVSAALECHGAGAKLIGGTALPACPPEQARCAVPLTLQGKLRLGHRVFGPGTA